MGSISQCLGAYFRMKVFISVSVTNGEHENEKGTCLAWIGSVEQGSGI